MPSALYLAFTSNLKSVFTGQRSISLKSLKIAQSFDCKYRLSFEYRSVDLKMTIVTIDLVIFKNLGLFMASIIISSM